MKALPNELTKKKMVELYCNQMSEKSILEEIRSFQEQLGFKVRCKLVHDRVKKLFFERFGLPTGYEIIEETQQKNSQK